MNLTSLWCLAKCMDALSSERYATSTLCSSHAQAACSISIPCSAPTSMTKPHSAMPAPHVVPQCSHLITFHITDSSACRSSHHHDVIIATPVTPFSLLSDDDFNAPVRNWFPVSTLHSFHEVYCRMKMLHRMIYIKSFCAGQYRGTTGLIFETVFFLRYLL